MSKAWIEVMPWRDTNSYDAMLRTDERSAILPGGERVHLMLSLQDAKAVAKWWADKLGLEVVKEKSHVA